MKEVQRTAGKGVVHSVLLGDISSVDTPDPAWNATYQRYCAERKRLAEMVEEEEGTGSVDQSAVPRSLGLLNAGSISLESTDWCWSVERRGNHDD